MFNFSDWLIEGIKAGYKSGAFAFCRVTEITAGYLSHGLITQAQAEEIAFACPAPETEMEENDE